MLSRRGLIKSALYSGAAAAFAGPLSLLAEDEAEARPGLASRIVEIANQSVGKTFGRGECTDFVDFVLKAAGAAPGRNYVWGRKATRLVPGTIVQFWDTHITSPDGRSTWGTAPGGQHTAIIIKTTLRPGSGFVQGITIAHQNDGVRSVTTRWINMSWSRAGRMEYYTPLLGA